MSKSLQKVNSVAKGSVNDVAQAEGKSVAEAIAACDYVVVIDQSGSMADHDARGGRSRYDVAEEELRKVQEAYPGRVLLVEFSTRPARYVLDGVPTRAGGSTDLTDALQFVKIADSLGLEIIVISDGYPDNEVSAIAEASGFQMPIHTIYIGVEGGDGEDFLNRLSKANKKGGQRFVAAKPGELAPGVIALLEGGK